MTGHKLHSVCRALLQELPATCLATCNEQFEACARRGFPPASGWYCCACCGLQTVEACAWLPPLLVSPLLSLGSSYPASATRRWRAWCCQPLFPHTCVLWAWLQVSRWDGQHVVLLELLSVAQGRAGRRNCPACPKLLKSTTVHTATRESHSLHLLLAVARPACRRYGPPADNAAAQEDLRRCICRIMLGARLQVCSTCGAAMPSLLVGTGCGMPAAASFAQRCPPARLLPAGYFCLLVILAPSQA
jgi:hypothetical protein